MASLGKKILSAFVEVGDDKKTVADKPVESQPPSAPAATPVYASPGNSKFKEYFKKLFTEANIPGPDYYEFSRMTDAMQAVADEKARYNAAFAGLSVQGLDKEKLLSTAAAYMQVLEKDALNFDHSVDTALQEKVHEKKHALEEKGRRIGELTQEISALQQQIDALRGEISENEEKIAANAGGYKAASEAMKQSILSDIQKIKQYIP